MHAAVLLAAIATAACSSATQQSTGAPRPAPAGGPREISAPPTTANAADVRFMSGMIPHHAQAVLIAGWAQSHGARPDVLVLCQRIVVGQRDEIALMQFWLREHGQPVPDAKATRMVMKMDGMDMGGDGQGMLMPGMLNDQQLAELDKARGTDFDRLFLIDMIGHHKGALTMVDELLGSQGAAQDDVVYRMSSDVYADQTTEIERMGKMLDATPPASHAP